MNRKNVSFDFKNSAGITLSGHIDMPADTAPVGYGVFTPCFTCVKDSIAAARICRAMAENGYAMLRFDTTGIGKSGGDHAATGFSTRVDDILSAVNALTGSYGAPNVLIGHSLGGTATLVAAAQVPDVDLVVTIGSPSDPASVLDGFIKQDRLTRHTDGSAEIDVLGTPYRFTHAFVEDLSDFQSKTGMPDLEMKVLVIQAPHDDIVPKHNAEAIAARYANAELMILPEAAHHLLTNAEDATAITQKILDILAQQ